MVVDPGCMKCMDCISVCPNDALYFGFGKPTIAVSKSKAIPEELLVDLARGNSRSRSCFSEVSWRSGAFTDSSRS